MDSEVGVVVSVVAAHRVDGSGCVSQHEIAMRYGKVFSRLDGPGIEEAVRRAEQQTSGEIVPLVVASADNYIYLDFIGALIGQIVFAALAVMCVPEATIVEIFLMQALGYMAGYVLCRYVPACKRLLLSAASAEERVHERAVRAFYELGLYKTRDRTGVLILVSLLERRVEVLADTGIHARVPPGTWDGPVKAIVHAMRNGDLSRGLITAIDLCGEILAREFPRKSDDTDELPNQLNLDRERYQQ